MDSVFPVSFILALPDIINGSAMTTRWIEGGKNRTCRNGKVSGKEAKMPRKVLAKALHELQTELCVTPATRS